MLPGDSATLRKARGAFFTPAPVARFIADWAVHSPQDDVFEPSCGEAVFLHEAGRHDHQGRLVGVELNQASASEAERTLRVEGIAAEVRTGDFFAIEPDGSYDAVIGNPPYVRYQDFTGEARSRSRAAALRGGVTLTGLASSWAAFTVHSALFLKSGGRLGLVLPAELLTVNYAADVRRFLMQHFKSVALVMFTERVFPDVLQEVVLLLAEGFDPEGKDGIDLCDIFEVRDADALKDLTVAKTWKPPFREGKWTASLISKPALAAFSRLSTGWGFAPLERWGDTTLGMVTGNNKYFALSPRRVDELGLALSDLLPLSPPGSRHLRGLTLSQGSQLALGDNGAATWLFRPLQDPSAAAAHYIREGEETGVHTAYKCRVRSPWWRVPYLRPANLLLTYMNADTPRLTTNCVRAHHLNSVHGVYLRPELRTDGMDLLPLASLNSVTLLSAETVGRAYGGGILKLEPREADHWSVPSPELIREHASQLNALRPEVSALLEQGMLLDATGLVDKILLVEGLGIDYDGLRHIRAAHREMTTRRIARGKGRSTGG